MAEILRPSWLVKIEEGHDSSGKRRLFVRKITVTLRGNPRVEGHP